MLVFLLFFAFTSCSAEQQHIAGTTKNKGTAGASQNVSGNNGAMGTVVEALKCNPLNQEQACFCPDGTQSGRQLCDENGNLWPCSGCQDPIAPNAEGALCADLRAEGAMDCEAKSYLSRRLTTSILFVVDRSQSMECNTPDQGQSSEECERESARMFPNQPSKWEITIGALKESFAALDGSGALAGLMFFSNDNYCGVHSDLTQGGVPIDVIGPSQIGLLSNALDNQSPAGGTPLVGATILAYAHLHQEAGGSCSNPPCGAPGNRFVVLLTDGADSCKPGFDDAPCGPDSAACTKYLLETEVPKAGRVNIRTFVIGAPGSELARGFLSDMAYRGGTAKQGGNCNHSDPNGTTGDCHFDMTNTQNFAADLSGALLDISGAALGCEFSVPVVPDADPTEVNVQYTLPGQDPICIKQDETVACEQGANGWQFARNPDGSVNLNKVVLCGEYCDLVESNPSIQVDVILGCTTLVII